MAIAASFPDKLGVYGIYTAAQIDAGVMVLPPVKDRAYTVVDCWMRSPVGDVDTAVSVDVTDGTTIFASFEDGPLDAAKVIRIGGANTDPANLGTTALANTGITVISAGGAIGTATHIDFYISYTVTKVA